MNRTVFLLSTGFLIFFILTVVFLILYIKAESERIDPNNCPKKVGDYGVISNVSPTGTFKVNYSCTATQDGTPGNSICQFGGIANLFEAQKACERYPLSTCGGFYYNEPQGLLLFVNTDYPIASSVQENKTFGNVYVRQV